jgi:general secretion pathway protein H
VLLDEKSPNRGRTAKGYTLVELLVVLALIGVAVALVVPLTQHSYAGLRLRMAASSVTSLLQQARSHARYKGRTELIIFTVASRSSKLLLVGEDAKPVNSVTLPTGIVLRLQLESGEWADRPAPLHFFPNGTSESALIDLRDDNGRHLQLELSPLIARARVAQEVRGD